MQRNIAISGMNNFRDMGGYPADSGKTVKWGTLYRSDQIFNADDKGLEELKSLNIRTIIDYRSSDEISKYPNPVLDVRIKTYRLDPDAHAAELAAQFSASREAEDERLVKKVTEQKEKGLLAERDGIVLEQYRNFISKPQSQQAFGEMLRIAARPETAAMVQHCRGGKDRTGFGAMLLLGILGVSREDLVADYMLTRDNRLERNEEKMEIYRSLTKDQAVLDYLHSFIDTRPDFIEASLAELEQNYGGIVPYAETALGVTADMVQDLKALYLE